MLYRWNGKSAGGARPAVPRGQHVGRAVEEREFCPVNLDPNDCDPPLLLPIRRQTTSAWPRDSNCQG